MTDRIFDSSTNMKTIVYTANTSAMSNTQVESHNIIQRAMYDIPLLSASEILRLQSLVGNQKVTGLINNMALSLSKEDGDISAGRVRDHAQKGIQTPISELPHADKIKKAFGKHDISSIKAHLGPEATNQAKEIQASAYTMGNDVVFAGQPSINTAAHEAAHVIQQQAGIRPVGGIGKKGDPYERNAEAVAARVEAGQSAEALLDSFGNSYMSANASSMTAVQACGDEKDDELPPKKPRVESPMDAKSRLERAHKRGEERAKAKPVVLGKRQDAPTHFGMSGLSQQPFSRKDPQTTTRAEDFVGSKPTGSTYREFLPKVGGPKEWQTMVDVIDEKFPVPVFHDMSQKRAMAMAEGTTHRSEEFRFPGAAKAARSTMRSVSTHAKSDAKPGELASSFIDLFPMAKPGGKHIYEDYLAGKVKLTKEQEEVLRDMSVSSSEE